MYVAVLLANPAVLGGPDMIVKEKITMTVFYRNSACSEAYFANLTNHLSLLSRIELGVPCSQIFSNQYYYARP